MPRFIVQINATAEYLQGVTEGGFEAREQSITGLIEAQGGKVEQLLWAHGPVDAYLDVEMPDAESLDAILRAAAKVGQLSTSTSSAFTSAEMDVAANRIPEHRQAGI